MEQTNKLQKFKVPAIYGGIFLAIIIISELIILATCKEELFCLGLGLVLAVPSAIIGIKSGTWLALIVNIIFYFLVGALIGFLVEKFRKKQ